MKTSGWMKLNLGDLVVDAEDPRHVGQVERIRWGHEVTVKWQDSGYISELPLHKIKVVERYRKNIIIR